MVWYLNIQAPRSLDRGASKAIKKKWWWEFFNSLQYSDKNRYRTQANRCKVVSTIKAYAAVLEFNALHPAVVAVKGRIRPPYGKANAKHRG